MSEIWEQVITWLVPAVIGAIAGFVSGYLWAGLVYRKPKSQCLRWAWIGAIAGFMAGIAVSIYS